MTDFPPRYEPATPPAAADHQAGQAGPQAGQAHAQTGDVRVPAGQEYQPASQPDPGLLTPPRRPGPPPPGAPAETRPLEFPLPDGEPRSRRTGLVILLSAVLLVLLAGLAWWVVSSPGRGRVSAAGRTPAAASPLSAAQQTQYQATRVRVVAEPRGVRVRWSRPSRTGGVAAFIVVAELGGRAQQEHTVGSGGRSAAFAGLRPGRRYCFVVGTVVELADGQAGTTTTPRVCRLAR